MKAATPYQLLKAWQRQGSFIFLILSALFIFGTILIFRSVNNPIIWIIGIVTLGLSGLYYLYHHADLAHRQNPTLEYSAGLLVDESDVDGLASFQLERAKSAFKDKEYKIPTDRSQLFRSVLFLIALLVGGWAIQLLLSSTSLTAGPLSIEHDIMQTPLVISSDQDSISIEGLSINITPPSYTGIKRYRANSPKLEIAEGSRVSWRLELSKAPERAYFLFSEGDTISVDKDDYLQKNFRQPDFYKYGFDHETQSFVSQYFPIKVISDEKPKVETGGIEEYLRLDWQKDHDISFQISIADDYGLDEAYISATVAKGSGEAVKFRERKFELTGLAKGIKKYKEAYTFSTKTLDMGPGDELYFYVTARDNYPYGSHWSKSITHFVTIADTVTYTYADESGMQVDLMPEFFRSQRQIIIDSERLLADRPEITKDSFSRASNALGFDQKMLRLKYGQFLGEENESGIDFNNELEGEEEHDHDHDHDHGDHEGHDHGHISDALQGARDLLSQYMHDHDHEEEEGQLMATKGTERKSDPSRPTWVEELSHNHDDNEVATFLDISAKSKLKAALSIMWDAELHLRLYDPVTSLPFQYESLELLQQVKNHARIYVHRIGFDPPVIKEETLRLSGDRDEIIDPSLITDRNTEDEFAAIKTVIEQLGSEDLSTAKVLLSSVMRPLASLSLEHPEVLPILSKIDLLVLEEDDVTMTDLLDTRRLLISVLPEGLRPVQASPYNAHHITKTVAQKMTF